MREEDLKVVDQELRLFVRYCRSLPDLYDKMRKAAAKYYWYGVSSPAIRSPEEAKYQSGTPAASDKMGELLAKKDELEAEYRLREKFCYQIQEKLMELSEDEIELLYWRYEKELTLRQLGMIYHFNKNSVALKIRYVLLKFCNT